MFQDGRSRRVVFLAHCLLNQNSISDGTAVYPAAFREVVDTFLEADVGIVQMPCPELCCLGLDRGDVHGAERPVVQENTRIRREMKSDEAQKKLQNLADYVMLQIDEYTKHGFEILGIVGANRSPNCGVETTSEDDREVSGRGLFMEELDKRISVAGLRIPMIGLKASENPVEKARALLN